MENLLAVTKIEDSSIRLHTSAELDREVVDEALHLISRKKAEHQIVVWEREEVLLAQMDAKLIIQVLINLMCNAIKYTPAGSEIVVSIAKENGWTVISIADNCCGIPLYYTGGLGKCVEK